MKSTCSQSYYFFFRYTKKENVKVEALDKIKKTKLLKLEIQDNNLFRFHRKQINSKV